MIIRKEKTQNGATITTYYSGQNKASVKLKEIDRDKELSNYMSSNQDFQWPSRETAHIMMQQDKWYTKHK